MYIEDVSNYADPKVKLLCFSTIPRIFSSSYGTELIVLITFKFGLRCVNRSD